MAFVGKNKAGQRKATFAKKGRGGGIRNKEIKDDKYVVTAEVRNQTWPSRITEELPKERAEKTADELRQSMKRSIPKYKWAKDIKVKKM